MGMFVGNTLGISKVEASELKIVRIHDVETA